MVIIDRVALRPDCHVETSTPDGLHLVSATGRAFLQDRVYQPLTALLDGRYSTEEIVDRLGHEWGPAHVYYALLTLQRAGYVVPAAEDRASRSPSPEALSDPLAGIVRSLRKLVVPGIPLIHAYVATAARPRGPDLRRGCPVDWRLHSGGKGTTDALARASAVGEVVERYSGIRQGDEPRCWTTLRELGNEGMHPNACMLYSQAQYRSRPDENARFPLRPPVPAPLDPDVPLEWTPVWSLSQERHRYLPTDLLYYSSVPTDRGPVYWADSNGCAAGSSLEDATLSGILELVERDSIALWWYHRVRRPGFDLQSVEHPYARDLVECYRGVGRDVWLLDLTSDLGIPCFGAVSRRVGTSPQQIALGFAADTSPEAAALRALTEMNQVLAVIFDCEQSGAAMEDEFFRWLWDATVEHEPYFLPAPCPPTGPASFAVPLHRDARERIDFCRGRLEDRGMEVLVLDQTRPDVGIPVARVIVPGLRHCWPRFGPGRLFEVPVRLGWITTRRSEAELNPIPCWL